MGSGPSEVKSEGVCSSPPLVTVVVPSYNHRMYVADCISSVQNQTYSNIELIVIDDGSTDQSQVVIEELKKVRSFEFYAQENCGLAATLNRAIRLARGKYICFLASDDEFLLDKLSVLVSAIERQTSQYAVVFGDAEFMDEHGRSTEKKTRGSGHATFIDFYFNCQLRNRNDCAIGSYESLIEGNYIPGMSALIRRESILDVGLFDEDISVEDWDLWLKLAKKYQFLFCDKVVARYRFHQLNSVQTMTPRLCHDTLRLLEREETYCVESGYLPSWRKNYYSCMITYREIHGLVAFFGRLELKYYSSLVAFSLVRIFKILTSRIRLKTKTKVRLGLFF